MICSTFSSHCWQLKPASKRKRFYSRLARAQPSDLTRIRRTPSLLRCRMICDQLLPAHTWSRYVAAAAKSATGGPGPRRRRQFTLTAAGRKELQNAKTHLAQLSAGAASVPRNTQRLDGPVRTAWCANLRTRWYERQSRRYALSSSIHLVAGLGHRDFQMTCRYSDLAPRHQRSVVDLLLPDQQPPERPPKIIIDCKPLKGL